VYRCGWSTNLGLCLKGAGFVTSQREIDRDLCRADYGTTTPRPPPLAADAELQAISIRSGITCAAHSGAGEAVRHQLSEAIATEVARVAGLGPADVVAVVASCGEASTAAEPAGSSSAARRDRARRQKSLVPTAAGGEVTFLIVFAPSVQLAEAMRVASEVTAALTASPGPGAVSFSVGGLGWCWQL